MNKEKNNSPNRMIVPVYINEKIVLDMLAIIEDGFSVVSQVNYSEQLGESKDKGVEAGVSASGLLGKLLKIDITAASNHSDNKETMKNISTDRVHTNTSLLAKFRDYLVSEGLLKCDVSIDGISVGDFVEIQGELQKNPLIYYMDSIADIFRMVEIFKDTPELGNKKQASDKDRQNKKYISQVEAFTKELKHSGTIDFVLSSGELSAVLSAQEKYLTNDNISEILGGRFKILGKVISICEDESERIDLLRKTVLSALSDEMLKDMISGFESNELNKLALPELKTQIEGPTLMLIPVAIYA